MFSPFTGAIHFAFLFIMAQVISKVVSVYHSIRALSTFVSVALEVSVCDLFSLMSSPVYLAVDP